VVLFEGTFFWIEVKVVFVESVKDLLDQEVVAGDMFILCLSLFLSCVNGYVIHVNCDASSINEILEYGVHHSLKGGRRIGQAKEHYCRFKESFICDEGHLPPVFFFDKHLIVPPFDIHPSEQGAASQSVDWLGDEREWVVVLDGPGVHWSVVLNWPQFSVFLLNEEGGSIWAL
jgi:hypothetical protein